MILTAAAPSINAVSATTLTTTVPSITATTGPGGFVGSGAGGPCDAFPGARQLPGADGVVLAAWSGAGLVVPACGPPPGYGAGPGNAGRDDTGAPVYPYPGAPWTAGYQCVEFSERYLYERYGVTMGIATNGDQVAARYAAGYPGLFMVIRNGTRGRPPVAGDVLSLSAAPGFDSASGGHTAVVQSSTVNRAGNGTITVVEENADAAGVAVVPVAGWTVRYPGFAFAQWLTTADLTVTSPHQPRAQAGKRYAYALSAAGGRPPYRWRVTSGALPAGLALPATGTVRGTGLSTGLSTGRAAAQAGDWPVTVAVTDTRGATAAVRFALPVAASAAGTVGGGAAGLRDAEWAWQHAGNAGRVAAPQTCFAKLSSYNK